MSSQEADSRPSGAADGPSAATPPQPLARAPSETLESMEARLIVCRGARRLRRSMGRPSRGFLRLKTSADAFDQFVFLDVEGVDPHRPSRVDDQLAET